MKKTKRTMARSVKKSGSKATKQKRKCVRRNRQSTRKLVSFLQTLKELRPVHRSIMLGHLKDESCESLYEVVANVLKNPRLSHKEKLKLKKALSPYKSELRHLANKKKSRVSKHKKLLKLGGSPLASILQAAIPLLLSLI